MRGSGLANVEQEQSRREERRGDAIANVARAN